MIVGLVHFRIYRISVLNDIGQSLESSLVRLIGHVVLVAEEFVDFDTELFVLLHFWRGARDLVLGLCRVFFV